MRTAPRSQACAALLSLLLASMPRASLAQTVGAPGAIAPPTAAGHAPPITPAQESSVISFHGFVELARGGQPRHERFKTVPVDIASGDEIRTYRDGEATLRLTDGSRIIIGPNSVFTLEEQAPSRIRLRLNLGRLWAIVTQVKSRQFEVRTPVAVASVRGTEFGVAAASNRSSVEVFGGMVAVKGSLGDEALLLAGQRVGILDGRLEKVEHFQPEQGDLRTIRQARQAQGQPVEADAGKDKTADAASDGLKAALEREVGFQVGRDAVETAAAFEMKSALFQEGKDIIDAYGQRVRLEQYMLRPTPNSFKFVSLNFRDNRLDFGTLEVVANATLPEDLSQAGDLFFSPGPTQPPFYAVKERAVFSNSYDSVVQLGVDGQSMPATFQTADNPSCTGNSCTYSTGQFTYYQTVFGNRYEFINGSPTVLNNIWTGATCASGTCAARPADDPAMMWHSQPVQINVLPKIGPPVPIASYWQDSFVTTAGAGIGKAVLDSFYMPDPTVTHLVEYRDYLKFQDATGLGFLNFGEPTTAGDLYGAPGTFVYLHYNQRLDGLSAITLPGGTAQRAAAVTTVFADNNGSGLPGGNPSVAASSPFDPLLFNLSGVSNTWQQIDHFLVDDFGNLPNPQVLFSNSASGDNATASLFEQLNYERAITSSQFPGRKIDVVMDPQIMVESSIINPSNNGDPLGPP